MALQEYVGAVVMEVNGQEIEVVSISPSEDTGRKVVKTMNRSGRASGFAQGVAMFDLRLSAVIPVLGEPLDWAAIEGAKITIAPVAGGKRTSYLDCFTISVGRSYQVDGEARIDISMSALRKVEE